MHGWSISACVVRKIVVQDQIVGNPSKDEELVSVNLEVVECPWKELFLVKRLYLLACERVQVYFEDTVFLGSLHNPADHVQVLSHHTHLMPIQVVVGELHQRLLSPHKR